MKPNAFRRHIMEWEVEELQKLSKIQPDIVNGALKEMWQKILIFISL